jgi:LysR family hydrogen peroxide-inducible transcriptional activator
MRHQALAVCERRGAREHPEFRATSLSTLAQMVASGNGITLLPELSLATEARRAPMRVRRFASPVPYRTIALVWRKHSPLAATLREIALTIREAYPVEGTLGETRTGR